MARRMTYALKAWKPDDVCMESFRFKNVFAALLAFSVVLSLQFGVSDGTNVKGTNNKLCHILGTKKDFVMIGFSSITVDGQKTVQSDYDRYCHLDQNNTLRVCLKRPIQYFACLDIQLQHDQEKRTYSIESFSIFYYHPVHRFMAQNFSLQLFARTSLDIDKEHYACYTLNFFTFITSPSQYFHDKTPAKRLEVFIRSFDLEFMAPPEEMGKRKPVYCQSFFDGFKHYACGIIIAAIVVINALVSISHFYAHNDEQPMKKFFNSYLLSVALVSLFLNSSLYGIFLVFGTWIGVTEHAEFYREYTNNPYNH